ncbi:uncharacterized protein [Nicotiana tomentosiformis]|uniref:uncharacterized protein n=1 Tax=Nicotiana tomentosiformis TaxID=4098 RepID=UPI00388CB21A
MDLVRERKIVFEDEKASANQVSITFGAFSLDVLCSLKEIKDEKLLENNKVEVDHHDNDEGWTLVTHCRRHKRSPRKESIEQQKRKMMVKRPRIWNLVKHLKKAKVEVHHPQKPRHLVTLEEFLPSWFHAKISHEGINAYCCHDDKEEEKSDDLPSAPSSEKFIESIPQEVNACEEKVTFTNDNLLLGDTLYNRLLYLVGYMGDERVNQILVDGESSVNILPISAVKELGIPMNELSESRVMIQGFNQGGQRAIGTIRPWIHENKVVPSTYHQCLKYYEGEIEKKIIVDDEPFTEAESHFVDVKFYSKNYIVKEPKADDGIKRKNDEPTTTIAEVIGGSAKAVTEEVQPNANKSHRGDIASYGKKAVKLSSKPLAGFVAQNRLQNMALPTQRTCEGFDPNAYRLFAKAGYNPNEPSKLGNLPSEAAMRQPREGLGYKKLSPMRISIRRASSNYITVEDESTASNRPFVFDRLGKSTARTFVFEILGPLKQGNKFQRNYRNTRTPALPKIQKISKDFQSLVPSRMKRQTKVMVSCDEVLKVKPYTMFYTKECDEDEESVGSLYHVTAQGEHGVLSLMEDDEKLDDISPCYHISFNDGDPQEDEDAKNAPSELEEGVKATIDALKKEFRDVFAWSYKEMPGLDHKVAVHHLVVKNGARPIKQAQRRFRSNLVPLIETEVNKLIEARFIREVKYPTWVSSIVPVRKKNGQIRVCVDFRDINNACPKDEFLFPIPELMIDATTGVMPFGLKNAGATYQRAMQNIFDALLYKNVECYVDNLVVKSRKRATT